MPKFIDLTGKIFGRLTCIERVPTPEHVKFKRTYWKASCSCGGFAITTSGNLNSGITQSCGCFMREAASAANFKHGKSKNYVATHSGAKEDNRYDVWQTMRKRCSNPKFKDWEYYGGKGIKVCPEWDDFTTFIADVGVRPDMTYTLERRDGNADYCASNCYWATPREQALNRAGHARWKEVTIEGIKYPSYARASLATGIAVHMLQKLFKLKKETINV